MTFTYNQNAKKKATNLTINSDLLRIAKEMKINLSSSFESFLAEKLKEKQTLVWIKENKDAIEQYNKDVEQNGVFSDGLRSF
jgi:antitoxin CcdA